MQQQIIIYPGTVKRDARNHGGVASLPEHGKRGKSSVERGIVVTG